MKQSNLVLLISLFLIILGCKSENDIEITKEEFLGSAEKKKPIDIYNIEMSEEDIELSYKFKTWQDNQLTIAGREADAENNPLISYLEKKML